MNQRKVILIVGAPASGKYTIGKALSEQLKCRFLHEHQMLDIAAALFDNTRERISFYFKLRLQIFSDILKYDTTNTPIITTFVHLFDDSFYNSFLTAFIQSLKANNCDIFIVELQASFQERQKRNLNPDRLLVKPTKRDITKSSEIMNRIEKQNRIVSNDDDTVFEGCRHIRIDSENAPVKAIVEDIILFARSNSSICHSPKTREAQ